MVPTGSDSGWISGEWAVQPRFSPKRAHLSGIAIRASSHAGAFAQSVGRGRPAAAKQCFELIRIDRLLPSGPAPVHATEHSVGEIGE